MAWWIEIRPEVVRGLGSFRLGNDAEILEMLEENLTHSAELFIGDRWEKCPSGYFVYSHVMTDVEGRIHLLEFVVNDEMKEMGVLRVVWVEQS